MKIIKLGVAMKIDRHGQAKILTVAEIQLLFNEGFTVDPPRDRALFAVCLYIGCRISEAVTLTKRDGYDTKGNVRPRSNLNLGRSAGSIFIFAINAAATGFRWVKKVLQSNWLGGSVKKLKSITLKPA